MGTITKVSYNNFRGQSATHNFTETGLTGITGRNGSGKSTILKAVELAVYGHCPSDPETPKSADGIFRFYGMGDTDGEMSVELTLSDGDTITRSFTRFTDSRGKSGVNQELFVCGKKFKMSDDLIARTGLKIADVSTMWRSAPQKQIEILCQYANIPPAALDDYDRRIATAQDQKNKAHSLMLNKKKALDELATALQEFRNSQTDGSDALALQTSMERAIKLKSDLTARKQAILNANDLFASYQRRMEEARARLEEPTISPPDSVLNRKGDDVPIESLRANLVAMEEAKTARQLADAKQREIDSITIPSGTIPAPVAIPVIDTSELEAEIAKAEKLSAFKDSGIDAARSVISFWRECWRIMKPQIKDGMIEDVKAEILPLLQSYHDTVTAESEATAARAAAEELKSRLRKMIAENKEIAAKNLKAENEYRALQMKLEQAVNDRDRATAEMVKFGNQARKTHYTDELIRELRDEIARRSMLEAEVESYNRAVARDKKEREAALATMEDMLHKIDKAPPAEDEASLLTRIDEVEKNIEDLSLKMSTAAEFFAKKSFVDRCKEDYDNLEEEYQANKTLEKQLREEKLALLDGLQKKINDASREIVAPAEIRVEVANGRGGGVKFFLVSERGDIPRESLSGAEQVEHDAALGFVLTGKNGVILIEGDALDGERAKKMLSRINSVAASYGSQVVCAGHSLPDGDYDIIRLNKDR